MSKTYLGIAIGEGRVSQVTDNLRDRIAAVIHNNDPRPVSDGPSVQDFHLADAVIRELGLTYERSEWPFDGKHRYVTEWETNDD